MIKLFYSGVYKVRHEFINESNVCDMLKDDMRSKIVGDVTKTIYGCDGVLLKNNSNVLYIGGFYYEKKNSGLNVCENVVYEELNQIDKSDLVVVNLMSYSAIASITELIYASMKKKKIIIFCNPDITSYEINGEYWFPILTAKKLNKNIEIRYTRDENDIVRYLNSLEG